MSETKKYFGGRECPVDDEWCNRNAERYSENEKDILIWMVMMIVTLWAGVGLFIFAL